MTCSMFGRGLKPCCNTPLASLPLLAVACGWSWTWRPLWSTAAAPSASVRRAEQLVWGAGALLVEHTISTAPGHPSTCLFSSLLHASIPSTIDGHLYYIGLQAYARTRAQSRPACTDSAKHALKRGCGRKCE